MTTGNHLSKIRNLLRRFLPVLYLLLLGSIPIQASRYEDFLRFAETRQEYNGDESTLKMLYEQFLDGLTPDNQPYLIALGGSSGSGKTTFRKKFLKMENVHLHDMDEVMIRLPGYQEDLPTIGAKKAFEKWWPTARKTAQLLVQYAIESGYSIIYDRTCGAEGSYFDLAFAKQKGYHLQMIGMYTDNAVAKMRILKREQEEGRVITEAIFVEYRARFSALWPYYLNLVDEASLFQTNLETPLLIFSSQDGIQDTQTYQAFLQEGEPFQDFFAKEFSKG